MASSNDFLNKLMTDPNAPNYIRETQTELFEQRKLQQQLQQQLMQQQMYNANLYQNLLNSGLLNNNNNNLNNNANLLIRSTTQQAITSACANCANAVSNSLETIQTTTKSALNFFNYGNSASGNMNSILGLNDIYKNFGQVFEQLFGSKFLIYALLTIIAGIALAFILCYCFYCCCCSNYFSRFCFCCKKKTSKKKKLSSKLCV